MLSRVADSLFWMSRYLERAEQIARLLNVTFHLDLDLRGVLARPSDELWTSLPDIVQEPLVHANGNGQAPQGTIGHWLTFDLSNPSSILSCVGRARSNARSIRGATNSSMWRELNKLYWQLRDPEFSARAQESPHDFYQAVECGSQLFQGVCDATLTHDEGWQFIQLGKYLERADKTLRILDVRYQMLRQTDQPMDVSLSNLQWAGVLRTCLAYEAFQRLYMGRVDPERVVEFLLLHAEFPRSVRFSLEQSAKALAEIEGTESERGESKADRILGRVLSDLKYVESDQLGPDNLHAFISGLLDRCAQTSGALQRQYALQ
jgi:uncharacterized alpha-E superfamily protein